MRSKPSSRLSNVRCHIFQFDSRLTGPYTASQAGARNLGSRNKKLETDLFQQQEVLYGQEFTLMGLQRKLARLEGFKPIDEQDKLRAQIAELQQSLAAETGTNSLLTAQIRKVEDETRLLAWTWLSNPHFTFLKPVFTKRKYY